MNARLAGGVALGALAAAAALGVAGFLVLSGIDACGCSARQPYDGLVLETADAPPGTYGLRIARVYAPDRTYEGLDLSVEGIMLRFAPEGGDGSWRVARDGAALPRDARPMDGDVILLDPLGDPAPQVVRFIDHTSGSIILTLSGRFAP